MFEQSLEFLCAEDASPPELVSLADLHDIPFVSLQVFHSTGPDWRVDRDTSIRHETKRRLDDTGVKLDVIEAFYIQPANDLDLFRPALEAGAWLGARRVVMLSQDDDESRLLDRCDRFCELVSELGMSIIVEFTPRMTQKTYRQAEAFVTKIGRSDVTIEADSLHCFRGGTPWSDLAGARPDLLARAQLCDGPLREHPEGGRYEAINERMIPGEGVIPLLDFLGALPDGIVLGLEAPLRSLQLAGIDAAERVRRIVQASRRILAAHEAGQPSVA